jgi:hypothetical protein
MRRRLVPDAGVHYIANVQREIPSRNNAPDFECGIELGELWCEWRICRKLCKSTLSGKLAPSWKRRLVPDELEVELTFARAFRAPLKAGYGRASA